MLITEDDSKDKNVDNDLIYEPFYATLHGYDKTRLRQRKYIQSHYSMGNKNLENLDFIKEMKGKRRIDGLPFYDILENPDYRLRFEYADPVGIDKDGNVFFYEG